MTAPGAPRSVRPMIRRLAFVVLFACAHVAITMWAMLSALGAVMSGFDTGEITSPRIAAFYALLTEILISPLGTIDGLKALPGVLEYGVLFANGMLWAVVIRIVWRGGTAQRH